MELKYIFYITVNLVNGKFYFGVHRTNPEVFDGYIGCGIYRQAQATLDIAFHKAVKKYGYSSFRRQTIAVFSSEEEALELEALIVNQEFIEREDTYNVTLGGGIPPLHNKQVYQYSLKGDFIKEWESLTMAAEQYNTSGNILGISAKYKRTSIGYLWSFSKYDKLDISEYHIYNPKFQFIFMDKIRNILNLIPLWQSAIKICRYHYLQFSVLQDQEILLIIITYRLLYPLNLFLLK